MLDANRDRTGTWRRPVDGVRRLEGDPPAVIEDTDGPDVFWTLEIQAEIGEVREALTQNKILLRSLVKTPRSRYKQRRSGTWLQGLFDDPGRPDARLPDVEVVHLATGLHDHNWRGSGPRSFVSDKES